VDNNKDIVKAIYWTGYFLCLGLDVGRKIAANPETLGFVDFALSLFGALSSWFGVGVHMVKLAREAQSCKCGQAYGHYTDGLNATIGGTAIPVGIDNGTFMMALMFRPEEGEGEDFVAFVIPRKCRTIKYEHDKNH
jgi:hypothetical protein